MLCKHNDLSQFPAERTPSTRLPENEGVAADKVLPQLRFFPYLFVGEGKTRLFQRNPARDLELICERCLTLITD